MTLRALIVDDEPPARSELRYLLELVGGVEVVGEAASVREALALAGAVAYDVVFLDISMPGGTGMEAAQALLELPRRPAVVFVTAHDDFAVQAFSVDAVDYLLKPVDEGRLAQALARVSALRAAAAPAPPEAPVRIPVQRGQRTDLVDPDDVLCAEADGDYAWLRTAAGERLLTTRSLRELEDALPEPGFCRIHRSCLVNVRRVVALEQAGAGRWAVLLDDEAGTRLEVARRQTRGLKELLGI